MNRAVLSKAGWFELCCHIKVVGGDVVQPSKTIAADLGIRQRTVENHRAAIMAKTATKSTPALARLALDAAAA